MENFLLIGLFVLLGMLFSRLKSFPQSTPQVLNMFALYVSLPALVLLKAPQIAFTRDAVLPAALPWAMLVVSVGLVMAGARLFGWPRRVVGVLLMVVPLGNTSFLGVPMIQAFFGAAGLPYLLIYDQIGTMLTFATYGSFILAVYGEGERAVDPGAIARRMLLFPPTVALLAGLLLRCHPYPAKLAQALHDVSLSLVPLVMTAIGFQLRFRLKRPVLKPLAFGLAVKLLVAPLVALGLSLVAGARGLPMEVSVMEAGMPPMVTAAALAVVAGMDAELSAALVGIGIVLGFGTLPLLYLLLQLGR